MRTVFDSSFRKYGQVLTGYDFSGLLNLLKEVSEKPLDRVIYVPSCPELEAHETYLELKRNLYGGMDIDLGYCNGNNSVVNCLEYHKGSELQLAVEDTIIPVGQWRDIDSEWKYDLSKLELFFCPGGTAIELNAQTLHDSPFSTDMTVGFRMIIGLPRGTNSEMTPIPRLNGEDGLFASKNTWMLHYSNAPEVVSGSMNVGLIGKRMDVKDMLPFVYQE